MKNKTFPFQQLEITPEILDDLFRQGLSFPKKDDRYNQRPELGCSIPVSIFLPANGYAALRGAVPC
jgi:hypothetical protein